MLRSLATAQSHTLIHLHTMFLLVFLASSVEAVGADAQQCLALAESSPYYKEYFYPSGLILGYLPFQVCKELCPGWTHFPLSFIAFLVIQFILPTIIFAIVIPRRWHLDLPPKMFVFGHGGVLTLLKLFFISLSMVFMACVDLILWASAIMAFSGPMIFSVLHELYLDSTILGLLRASSSQSGHIALLDSERLDLLVTLVCGQFSGNPWNTTTTRIRSAFSASLGNANTLTLCKSRLKCVLTSQAAFGAAVGIATLFFLGGILYTANGILDLTVIGDDATPYALWLLTMLLVAIVASTPITGNAPSVVNALTNLPGHTPRFAWCPFLVDYYQGELYPTAMWDRGANKLAWLLESQANQNHPSFAGKVKLGKIVWVGLYLTAVFLSIFPGIMAFELAYNIPFPREGCRTFSYVTYITCQIWLTTITSLTSLEWEHFPVPKAALKYHQPWQHSLRISSYCFAMLTTAVATILAFLVSFLGTIFQILGVYNNCLCQTPVSTWIRSAADRRTWISFSTTEARDDEIAAFTYGVTWAVAGVTVAMCLLSWWYQKLAAATAVEEIDKL